MYDTPLTAPTKTVFIPLDEYLNVSYRHIAPPLAYLGVSTSALLKESARSTLYSMLSRLSPFAVRERRTLSNAFSQYYEGRLSTQNFIAYIRTLFPKARFSDQDFDRAFKAFIPIPPFIHSLFAQLRTLEAQGVRVVLLGNLSVAHLEKLEAVAGKIPGAHYFSCDQMFVTNLEYLDDTLPKKIDERVFRLFKDEGRCMLVSPNTPSASLVLSDAMCTPRERQLLAQQYEIQCARYGGGLLQTLKQYGWVKDISGNNEMHLHSATMTPAFDRALNSASSSFVDGLQQPTHLHMPANKNATRKMRRH